VTTVHARPPSSSGSVTCHGSDRGTAQHAAATFEPLARPADRERDLEDLAYLLGSYVNDDDALLWEETPKSLDYHHGPAWLLGRDMGRWLTDHEPGALREFLALARDEGDAHATGARMARQLPRKLRLDDRKDAQAVLLEVLEAFEMGLVHEQ
jgi:hypothetical protein